MTLSKSPVEIADVVARAIEVTSPSSNSATSASGKGATFTVRLPLATASAEASAQRKEPATAQTRADARHVLIVDDNQDAADLLASMLTALGHVTRIAIDGPTALETIREFVPDVALLDIGLPVMDGYELARRMRESPLMGGGAADRDHRVRPGRRSNAISRSGVRRAFRQARRSRRHRSRRGVRGPEPTRPFHGAAQLTRSLHAVRNPYCEGPPRAPLREQPVRALQVILDVRVDVLPKCPLGSQVECRPEKTRNSSSCFKAPWIC